MRRSGSTVLKAGLALAVCGSLAGCYEHHTADEELLDIPFQADAFPAGSDAGVHKDGSAGSTCAGSDPIALFFCSLQQQPASTGGTGTGTGSSAADIGTLLTSLLGGSNTGNNSSNPLAALATLFGNQGGTGNTGSSNPLADLLGQLGIPTTPASGTTTQPVRTRDAGAGQMGITLPTQADCANPTDQLTQFLCSMQTQMQKPADAGVKPAVDAALILQ